MSFMQRIFGTPAPTPAPAPAPTQDNKMTTPPNQNTQQSAQTSPNGVVPEGSGNPPNKEESPLKQFEALWQPTPTDKSEAPPQENPYSPEKFMEAAGKVDFTKVLNHEDLQKIAAGGEDAVKAFAAALNKTSQTVFGQSAALAHKLSEQAANSAREAVLTQLPALLKKHNANEGLLDSNPAFNNPALQPVVTALQSQFTEKYPNASAKEIQKMTMEYLQGAADLINPPKPKDSGPKGKDKGNVEDWSAYLNS